MSATAAGGVNVVSAGNAQPAHPPEACRSACGVVRVALVGAKPGSPGNRTGAGPPAGVVWPPQADVRVPSVSDTAVPGETAIDVGDAMTCAEPVPPQDASPVQLVPGGSTTVFVPVAPARWKTAPPVGAGGAVATFRHTASVCGVSATAVGPHRVSGSVPQPGPASASEGMNVSSAPEPSMFARPIDPPPHGPGGCGT